VDRYQAKLLDRVLCWQLLACILSYGASSLPAVKRVCAFVTLVRAMCFVRQVMGPGGELLYRGIKARVGIYKVCATVDEHTP
jgi:hypothetical protein